MWKKKNNHASPKIPEPCRIPGRIPALHGRRDWLMD
jgi:hypothetical protein